MPSFTFPMSYRSGSGTRIGFGTIEVPEVSSRETRAILKQDDVTYRAYGGRLWMPSVLAENSGRPISVALFDHMIRHQESREWDYWLMLHHNPFVENYSDHLVAVDSFAEDETVETPVDKEPMSERLRRSPEWMSMSAQAARTLVIGEVFHELTVGPQFELDARPQGKAAIRWKLGTEKRPSIYDVRHQYCYREIDAALSLFPDAEIHGKPPEVYEPFDDGFDATAVAVEAVAWSLLRDIRTTHPEDMAAGAMKALVALRRELEVRLPGRSLNYASQTSIWPRHASEIPPDAEHIEVLVLDVIRTFGITYLTDRVAELRKRLGRTDDRQMDSDTADAIASAFT